MALRSLPRAALGLALILPLAACGTAQQDPLVTAVRAIASGVLGGGDDAPAGPQLTGGHRSAGDSGAGAGAADPGGNDPDWAALR